MAEVPTSARVVVIGAGIVGNGLVWHLARLGWRDIVQIDKGALPNPGGSTGHASNFIFPVDHSREITDLTLDSVEQYKEMGVFTQSGGFEVARTEARMEELRRRMSSAKNWGIEAELVTPEQVVEKVPFLEKDVIIGAFWTPSVGVVDSLRAGTIMRERAMEAGALTVVPNVEVTGLDVEDGAIKRVRTSGGDIEAEVVVIACGVWSPKIAKMAGAEIPLTPAVHQMISVGPCPQLSGLEGEISIPIVRDMDTFCYERQHGADMEVGSYAHRPILWDPEDIPSIEQSKLSPTELPFTEEDFDQQLEEAFELMPDLLGAEGAEIRYAINGLLSLTPDGWPILGETPEVKNLWSAAAVWIKEGPGVARAVAERMTHGHSEIDISHSDIARFYPHQKTRAHIKARTSEAFNKTYGIIHPGEQYESDRPQRLAPMHAQQVEQGAVFFEAAGWERPFWYESNAGLVEEYGDQVMPREHEWDSRWWSPIINAEHLRMRETAGIVDLSAFAIFDVKGPGALEAVQTACVSQCDVGLGKVIYTPVLDETGGFVSDLTVMRLGHDHFRVVTGGAHGMVDRKWFADIADKVGGAGGDRPDVGVHHHRPLGPARPRHPLLGHLGRRVQRGLRLRLLPDHRGRLAGGARLADLLRRRAGLGALRPHRAGRPALEDPARGRRGPRRDPRRHRRLRHDRPHREGLPRVRLRARRRALDRRGRHAAAEGEGARLRRPARPTSSSGTRSTRSSAVLCTLTVDDHTSKSGVKRYMLGGEPILTRDGGTLDRRPRSPGLRHHRGLGAVARQARAARVPAARAGHDRQPAGGVLHGGALPGDRRLGRRHLRSSTPANERIRA